MKRLAMITARGNKRIPRKNIKEFSGKPIMVGDIIPLELSDLEVQDIDNEVDLKLAELKYQLLLPE